MTKSMKNNKKATITSVYIASSSITENKHLKQGSANLTDDDRTRSSSPFDFEATLRKVSRKIPSQSK